MTQTDISIPEKRIATDAKSISTSVHFLDLVFPPPRDFPIRLWDGTELPAQNPHSSFKLILKHPGALHKMFSPPIENSLGEAFMNSDFDIEGDILDAVSLSDIVAGQQYSFSQVYELYKAYRKLPKSDAMAAENRGPAQLSGTSHSRERDETAIQYHYDVSNEFYQLWLGKRMQYSCAYFLSGDEDINTAQDQKLELICRKLRLHPGERILDIGCGWGGLAIYMAENYDVSVVGISLSKNQIKYASEQVEKAGLGGKVSIRLQDYRDINDGPFDKVVSIGMFEHVGRINLPEYFAQVYRLLKPGGLFLNHGIGSLPPLEFLTGKGPVRENRIRPSLFQKYLDKNILAAGSFSQRYFFPDGELVPVSEANLVAARCGLELRDVENLREHYALTLRQWVHLMEKYEDEAIKATSEATLRTWRLYMASSAYNFSSGKINVNQALFSKPEKGISNLPLSRMDLYQTELSHGT